MEVPFLGLFEIRSFRPDPSLVSCVCSYLSKKKKSDNHQMLKNYICVDLWSNSRLFFYFFFLSVYMCIYVRMCIFVYVRMRYLPRTSDLGPDGYLI